MPVPADSGRFPRPPCHGGRSCAPAELEPKNNKQLMSFLGMLNLSKQFLPRAAEVLWLLTDTLKGGLALPVQWTEKKRAAFAAAKKLHCKATCLAHPRTDSEISLAVDVSNTHIGASCIAAGISERPTTIGFLFKEAG
jgi:RNase H-like domain found in reverse transcriptase